MGHDPQDIPGRTQFYPLRRMALAMACALFLLPLTACQPEEARMYDEAQALLLAERVNEAVAKLAVIVEIGSDRTVIEKSLFRLGEIYYLSLGEPQKGLDYFSQMVERSPHSERAVQALLYEAEIYEGSFSQYDSAILQYQRIIKEYGDHGNIDEYIYHIGLLYYQKGDCAQASIEWTGLINRFPESHRRIDAEYQKINCLFVSGASKKAIKGFEQLLRNYPDSRYDYDARLGMAMSYEELDKPSKALAEYRLLLERYPSKIAIQRKVASVEKTLATKK